jgi:hypothetical protein
MMAWLECFLALAVLGGGGGAATGNVALRGSGDAPEAYRLVRPNALQAFIDFDDAGDLNDATAR